MPLAILPDASDVSRRRTALNVCHDKGWFGYESENAPGFTDYHGVSYQVTTYSIRLPDGTPITLTAGEVDGFVYATALEHDEVEAIAYRNGM